MRKRYSTRIGLSLALVLAAAWLVGCGGEPVAREDQQAAAFADLRAAIEETITDEQRRTEVLTIVDSLENDIDELTALLVRRRTELRELNANYDATREDFDRFTSEMEARIRRNRQQALRTHNEIVSAVTAEEWATLEKAQTRAMGSIAETTLGI